MNRELQQADKVQKETERTRQEWITNITHDLKTPLSPIKGYAELLADNSVKEAQEIQEYGKIILKNVNHTEKLINDLKLTYQLESGSIPYSPKDMRIIRCVKEWVIDIINDPAFSDRDITFESSTPELVARIDPDLFRRAVQNLIINALTHNPENTKVKIAVTVTPENRVLISVQDNGVGISETDQAELFDRYYRGTNTKEKPEGSGLGLAIAKQIVTLHGGNIIVSSKLNAGTEFIISLPAQN
ncbi:MAG TPA: HAMP domain-containing histidine kinase, partial [Candidatus Blautia merdipullorum]|nr:HAMP domain-containing histidine kinase [Candidatus Blautia merdipullorum]